MAKDSDKCYGIIDHANKLGERGRVNPNRSARRKAAQHGSAVETSPAGDAAALKDEKAPDG